MAGLLLLGLVSVGACTSTADTSTGSSTIGTTTLVVNPADFLTGGVACTPLEGGMRSYVATATDVTDPLHPFALPSSVPTPCSQAVNFRYIQVNHVYTVEVDGYTQAMGELTPTHDPSSGSRHLVPAGHGGDDPPPVVAPRWTTDCGVAGVTAVLDEAVAFGACDALVDHAHTPSPTGVAVDPLATLGVLGCIDTENGTVQRFDVTPLTKGLTPASMLTCDAASPSWTEGVEPGVLYDFVVDAYRPKSLVPDYQATCRVRAVAGLTTFADCTTLAPIAAAK